MTSFTRRSFVKAISALEIGVAHAVTPVSAAMHVADILRLGDRRFKVCETRPLMGSGVTITAVHESKDAAVQGIEEAFSEMERLVQIFNRHQPDTPVSFLNETGRLKDAVPELRDLLGKAMSFYHRSGGVFDPTVLPVIEMIKSNAEDRDAVSLTNSDLHDALALVGAKSLEINDCGIYFSRSGMAVTLDGIGKGYIVDCASDVLSACGISNHLIDAGGDIRARGERAPGQPWIVVIKDPEDIGAYSAVIQLKDAAVATSGSYEIYFDAEHRRQSVNPQTSAAPRTGVSVSVTAPTVMEADALSTSAFVINADSAVRFINGQEKCECMMVLSGGAKLLSGCWDEMVRG